MSTGAVSAAQQSPTPTQLNRADSKGSLGQDAFLKLLVAQLQNQDPLAPTDSSQMMSQMAQFTSVEQLTNLANGMQSMQSGQDFQSSVALLGHTVTYTRADGTTASGTVDSVKPGADGAVLSVGNDKVKFADITQAQ